MDTDYAIGDLVYAKVLNEVPWPARILEILPGGKFSVKLFGTEQISESRMIFPYNQENRVCFEKHKIVWKKRFYKEAIEEIEKAAGPQPSEIDSEAPRPSQLQVRSDSVDDQLVLKNPEHLELFLQKLRTLAAENSQKNKQSKAQKNATHYKLITITLELRRALGDVKADPDQALLLLDRFKSEVLPKTGEDHFLRNPEAVNVIRQISNYEGNFAAWNFYEVQVREFKEKSKQIRKKAEEIFDAIKAIFPDEPQDSNEFFESFAVKAKH